MQVEDCSQSSSLSRHTCHPLLRQHHVQLPSCFFACYASWAVWSTQTDIQIDRKKCSAKACKAKSQLVHRHKNQREIVHHSQEAAPNVSYCQGSLQIASSLLPAHVQSSTRKNAHQMHPTIHPIQKRQACMHRKGRRRRWQGINVMPKQTHTHTHTTQEQGTSSTPLLPTLSACIQAKQTKKKLRKKASTSEQSSPPADVNRFWNTAEKATERDSRRERERERNLWHDFLQISRLQRK